MIFGSCSPRLFSPCPLSPFSAHQTGWVLGLLFILQELQKGSVTGSSYLEVPSCSIMTWWAPRQSLWEVFVACARVITPPVMCQLLCRPEENKPFLAHRLHKHSSQCHFRPRQAAQQGKALYSIMSSLSLVAGKSPWLSPPASHSSREGLTCCHASWF